MSKCSDGEQLLDVVYVKKNWKSREKCKYLSRVIIALFITIGILLAIICFLPSPPREPFCGTQRQHFLTKVYEFYNRNQTPIALSRQNRALKLGHHKVCNTNCYANLKFSEANIQAKLDITIGDLLMNGKFKWSITLSKVQMAFNRCYKNLNSTINEQTLFDVYNKMEEIDIFVEDVMRNNMEIKQDLTSIMLKFWKVFGVDILFQTHTDQTYTYKENERKNMVYIDQKVGPLATSDLLVLGDKVALISSIGGRLSDIIKQTIREYNTLITKNSDNPLKWEMFTVEEANTRWPFFDFALYFRELDYPRNNYKDGEEFKFVVTSVDYLDKLNDIFMKNERNATLGYLYYLGFYTMLDEYKKHLYVNQDDSVEELKHDEKLRRCASEIRHQLPLVVSRLYVDSLDEKDLELRIENSLTIPQIYSEIFMKTQDFVEGHLNKSQLEHLYNYMLPTKFFETDHGYIEEDAHFDQVHRRLKLNESQSFFEMLVELRKFNRLRSILCLNAEESSKCESYYSKTSCATPHITYIPQTQTINLPVGLMALLQETYDEHTNSMDHHSRFDKMLSTLRCLIRQALKERMTKSSLFWDKNGKLREENELKEILSFPKVFKCDKN